MRRFALLAITAVTLSCDGGAGVAAPPPSGDSPSVAIRLPVRIHILSSRLGVLDGSLTDSEAATLLARVNEVWAQADIVWELESVTREQVEAEDQFELALQGGVPLTFELLLAAVPRGQLLGGGWDVFIVRDLTSAIGAPGVYFPSIPFALASELDPAGLNDPGRILAHELGHSLTLAHVQCTTEGNLMSGGCAGSDRTRLTPSQIELARSQAERGVPSAF